jgi:hypothetical protein
MRGGIDRDRVRVSSVIFATGCKCPVTFVEYGERAGFGSDIETP